MLTDGAEIALIDVRELGQHADGHPFLASNLPFSRLEIRAPALLPRKAVRIVLLDAGDGVAARAADRLAAMGYTDLTVMEGGAPGWRAAGYELFDGVNLPSKTFGELAELHFGTPHISARDFAPMLARLGQDVVLVDGRTPREHRRMNIPGSMSCPNAELALRIGAIATRPDQTIVVHCAGRTRSIIGAQSLIALGLPNRVLALENGTQGWELAGLSVQRGSDNMYPAEIPPAVAAEAKARARALAARHDLPRLAAGALAARMADQGRTTYLFDVRTEEEYAAGHRPGAVHAPGGQLVQATDEWIAVRGARVVVCDDGDATRATLVVYWLRQMGHDAVILDEEPGALTQAGLPAPSIPYPPAPVISAAQALDGRPLLDLRSALNYRKGHVEGAQWASRPRLPDLAGRQAALIADDPLVAALVARDLPGAAMVEGGQPALAAAGARIVATPGDPPDAQMIDYVFHTHDRHVGNLAAAQAYIDWELGLIARLDADERAVFTLYPPG
ncbi:MAG: rhodanese-related sulfurtransferase [Thalassobaculales bacterium]